MTDRVDAVPGFQAVQAVAEVVTRQTAVQAVAEVVTRQTVVACGLANEGLTRPARTYRR